MNCQQRLLRLRTRLRSAEPGSERRGLNRLAEIERNARTLLNRAQFDIENTAQRLEWAVRGAKPELIGYNAQWTVMDISRYSREFTWRLRDLSFDAQSLVSATRP